MDATVVGRKRTSRQIRFLPIRTLPTTSRAKMGCDILYNRFEVSPEIRSRPGIATRVARRRIGPTAEGSDEVIRHVR
jgi:hypothetical protein